MTSSNYQPKTPTTPWFFFWRWLFVPRSTVTRVVGLESIPLLMVNSLSSTNSFWTTDKSKSQVDRSTTVIARDGEGRTSVEFFHAVLRNDTLGLIPFRMISLIFIRFTITYNCKYYIKWSYVKLLSLLTYFGVVLFPNCQKAFIVKLLGISTTFMKNCAWNRMEINILV